MKTDATPDEISDKKRLMKKVKKSQAIQLGSAEGRTVSLQSRTAVLKVMKLRQR